MMQAAKFFFGIYLIEPPLQKKKPYSHCSTLRVGLCISGSTLSCSREMPPPARCHLDLSWTQVPMCRTPQSTQLDIILFYSFVVCLLSFVSLLMFETTSFLCASARLFGWQAAKTCLQMSVLFNDLISESLI